MISRSEFVKGPKQAFEQLDDLSSQSEFSSRKLQLLQENLTNAFIDTSKIFISRSNPNGPTKKQLYNALNLIKNAWSEYKEKAIAIIGDNDAPEQLVSASRIIHSSIKQVQKMYNNFDSITNSDIENDAETKQKESHKSPRDSGISELKKSQDDSHTVFSQKSNFTADLLPDNEILEKYLSDLQLIDFGDSGSKKYYSTAASYLRLRADCLRQEMSSIELKSILKCKEIDIETINADSKASQLEGQLSDIREQGQLTPEQQRIEQQYNDRQRHVQEVTETASKARQELAESKDYLSDLESQRDRLVRQIERTKAMLEQVESEKIDALSVLSKTKRKIKRKTEDEEIAEEQFAIDDLEEKIKEISEKISDKKYELQRVNSEVGRLASMNSSAAMDARALQLEEITKRIYQMYPY